MRKRERLALYAIGGAFLIGSAFATLTRDSSVEAQLRALLAQELSAPCTFESASFSFLEGLRVTGLQVLDPQDPFAPPLVDVGEAKIDYRLGLFGQGPRLTQIVLHSPRLRVHRDADGFVSLARIVRLRETESEPPSRLPLTVVQNGTIEWTDDTLLAPGAKVSLTGISVKLRLDDDGLNAHLTGSSDLLGPVSFDLTADPDARSAIVEVELQRLTLAEDLGDLLTGEALELGERHRPRGELSARATIHVVDGKFENVTADADMNDVSARIALPAFEDTRECEPFDITGLSGRLSLKNDLLGVSLELDALGGTIRTVGEIDLARDVVDLRGTCSLPASRDLRPYLPLNIAEIQRSYSIIGSVGGIVHVHGPSATAQVDAQLELRDASASYEGGIDEETGESFGFPWAVFDLVGSVDVIGSRVEFDAKGKHGDADVTVTGFTDVDAADRPITDVSITAVNCPLDDDIRAGFRENAAVSFDPWMPSGVAERVEVRVLQNPEVEDSRTTTDVVVSLDGRASFVPEHLPTQLTEARGVVRVLQPVTDGVIDDLVDVDLRSARGEAFTVSVRGTVTGSGSDAVEDLLVAVTATEIETSLLDALHASPRMTDGTKRALTLLDPRGSAVIVAGIRATGEARSDTVEIQLENVEVAGWEGVPMRATELRGVVTIADDTLSFDRIDGFVLGSRFSAIGRLDGLSEEEVRPHVEIEVSEMPIGDALRSALGVLAEGAESFWDELRPGADARADGRVIVRPTGDPSGQVEIHASHIEGPVDLIGFRAELTSGTADLIGNEVTTSFDASVGAGSIAVQAATMDLTTGNLVGTLGARGLRFPEDLQPILGDDGVADLAEPFADRRLHLEALRISWRAEERRLEMRGPLSIRPAAREGAAASGLDLDAAIEMESCLVLLPLGGPATFRTAFSVTDAHVVPGVAIEALTTSVTASGRLGAGVTNIDAQFTKSRFRVFDREVKRASWRLRMDGSRLWLEDLEGRMHGGELTGSFRRGGPKLAYQGEFTLVNGDVASATARAGGEESSGIFDARLRLRSETGRSKDMTGTGNIEFHDAQLRVPFVTRVLGAVDTALLGATGVEGVVSEGHIDFDVRGRRALITDALLTGPQVPLLFGAALELRNGEGAVGLEDGRLDVRIDPRLRFRALDIDPTGVFQATLGAAQFLLRRMRVEGTLRNPRPTWEVISDDSADTFRPRPRPVGDVRPYGTDPW